MNIIRELAVVVVALGSVSVAQADLISVDDAVFGADSVTRDSGTGLEWLDLSLTVGLTTQEILNGEGGFLDEGFRYATWTEVFGVYESAGLIDGWQTLSPQQDFTQPGFGVEGISITMRSLSENWVSLFGITETSNLGGVNRIVSSGIWWEAGQCFASSGGIGTVTLLGDPGINSRLTSTDCFQPFNENTRRGSFLYRITSVPEPTTLALLFIGLLGMAATRRLMKP